MTPDPPALCAEGLVRRIAGVDIVAGASLTLGPGESASLVGPSGCGKTTLLSILGLLDAPTSGRVLLHGVEAWSLGADARAQLRRERIGFVFQQNNLMAHLTARENVALPAWRLSGSRRDALHAADALLASFGLSHRAATRAAVLSTGEAQRVAIARALVNRPDVVLADEPTGSLDGAAASMVLRALDEVCALGTALLVVTHDPSVAARWQRTLAMRGGKIEPA